MIVFSLNLCLTFYSKMYKKTGLGNFQISIKKCPNLISMYKKHTNQQ